jgi:putative addiction module killer protein
VQVEARPRQLEYYVTENERAPFKEWLSSLSVDVRGFIRVRLRRIENGNLGNSHGVGEGVSELVFDKKGPGYRVYFGQDGDIVVLLTGGDKKTQFRDIENAKAYWRDYRA